jgi:hypothetical protein
MALPRQKSRLRLGVPGRNDGLLRCWLLGLAVVWIRDPAAAACSNEMLGHISLVHWRA